MYKPWTKKNGIRKEETMMYVGVISEFHTIDTAVRVTITISDMPDSIH